MNREIEHAIETAMTVEDLISELSLLDPKAFVLFKSDYGDYHHTQQALTVDTVEQLTTASLAPSTYSHSGVAVLDEEEENDEDWDMNNLPGSPDPDAKEMAEEQTVVVLS